MDKNTLNIYEDALMDICKKQKLPEMLKKLPEANFNKIQVNKTYFIMGIKGSAEKTLHFDARKTDNFPGDELVSPILTISEQGYCKYDTFKICHNHTYGQIILTHHDDLNKWSGSIHLHDEDKGINRLERISSVDFL